MKINKVLQNLRRANKHNIAQYIEGNARMLLDDGLFNVGTADHIKQQIIWRAIKCKACYDAKECLVCECSVPGKWYASESCNTMKFGNFVDEAKWEKQKEKMNITWEMIVEQFINIYGDKHHIQT